MATLRIDDMPESLCYGLKQVAAKNDTTVRALVLAAIRREVDMWEWRQHMAQRPETDLGVSAASLLKIERTQL